MKRFGFICKMCVVMFLAGCNEFQQAVKEAKQETAPPPKDNYIVLLDLSDRILFNNQQQVSKDLTAVSTIFEIFKARIREKDPTRLYYTVSDKLKILIAPQKTTPRQLYEMVGGLRVELSSELPDKKASAVDSAEKKIATLLPDIYKQAVISHNSAAYSGADIWKYFDEDLSDDLEKDAANTLFIVTDGYLNFENIEQRQPQNNRFASCTQIINAVKKYPDWSARFDSGDYGLLPVTKKFGQLKVVLLQLNPKTDWSGEYTILTKIWGKWFNEMGISSYHFVKEDNINEVRESIEKFMQVKIAGNVSPVSWTPITDREVTNVFKTDNATTTITFSTVSEYTAAAPAAVGNTQKTNHLPGPSLAGVNPVVAPIRRKQQKNQSKVSRSKKEDDILHDGSPRKGFNTGIRKND